MYVQNFVAIWWTEIELQQKNFPLNLNYEGKIISEMGPMSGFPYRSLYGLVAAL